MAESPKFPVLEPELQISLYSRLQDIRARLLGESLKTTVEADDLDLGTLDGELARYAAANELKRLASFGLRGEVFFPVPYLVARNPFLLGYYRLLLGFSRKAFYEQGPFKRFAAFEDAGKIKEELRSQIPALCLSLAASAATLVGFIDPLHLGIVNDLQILTLGAQFRGSSNVRVGQDAVEELFDLLRRLLQPYKPKIQGRKLVFKNDSALPIEVRFGSDPDVSVTQQLKSHARKLVAIEIKGGGDVSNVWNRLGEAEKSHQTAKHQGYNELWTVLRVDIAGSDMLLRRAKEKSPSTTHFFCLGRIVDRTTEEGKVFLQLFGSIVGAQLGP